MVVIDKNISILCLLVVLALLVQCGCMFKEHFKGDFNNLDYVDKIIVAVHWAFEHKVLVDAFRTHMGDDTISHNDFNNLIATYIKNGNLLSRDDVLLILN